MKMKEYKIKFKWYLSYFKAVIEHYLKYYLCFGWYLNYITKKKFSFKKMNKFEDWIYYKFVAPDFHDYVERNT